MPRPKYLSIPYSWGPLGHHTTWQPTFAIPLVPLLSLRRRSVPNPPNPGCYLPIVFSVGLSFSLLVQCPGGLSWQVPRLLWHAHTTSFCVFSHWTRVLRWVQWLSESCFAPLRWWCGLCTRCQGDVWNFSFPLSVSFSLFLLIMSKSHKNIKIWTWPRSATVWSLSWGLWSCRPRWSWALWVLLWSGKSWNVFQAWILRQWLWLPNIWSFERFSGSRHWPWCYCWCHWCCWSSIWSSQHWSACRMR